MPRPFPRLTHPIVQAPMAGGPSTPLLAATVSNAGGLGFLAAGYRTAEELRAEILAMREQTHAQFGVNVFLLDETPVDAVALSRYAQVLLEREEDGRGALGTPRFEDDALQAKLEVLFAERPSIVSFTFGCPGSEVVERLHEHDISVWVTVTEPEEALAADAAGADAVIAQGVEAGGHRGSFSDTDGRGELSLIPLLRLSARVTGLALVASGGIADGAGVAAALAAGASAVQIGSGFLRCPEAATSPVHRDALTEPTGTALTRVFTGRRARGLANRFMRDYAELAPSAYPHVHHLTAPLRAVARRAADPDRVNLWAGEAHMLAEDVSAAVLVRRWSDEARASLGAALQQCWPPA